MNKDSKIYIAGHRGLVGSAIHRKLISEGYTNIVVRTSEELDLLDKEATYYFFNQEKPDYVFLCAAVVGGVKELGKNKTRVLMENIAIQMNVFSAAFFFSVKKLMFFGTNCIYPKLAMQPLKEQFIMAGKLEPSTEYYAIAKIAGIKMCQAYRQEHGCDFITVLPVNMYGENDTYNLEKSHVMPALLMKFKEAKQNDLSSVEIWGTGNARREFMHSDDLAEACLFLMLNYSEDEPINIGTGFDISIRELAILIKEVSGFKGDLIFNSNKPEGISGKLLDITKMIGLGWTPQIRLRVGIERVYNSL